MPIELLYLIPILALSLLVLINVLLRQRSAYSRMRSRRRDWELAREVEEFNVGRVDREASAHSAPETRLGEIEKTISLVMHTLSNQQRLIEGFKGAGLGHSTEIDALKSRLRELQREYDIILSENYSLRAKVRKLETRLHTLTSSVNGDHSTALQGSAAPAAAASLYEDTELITNVNYGDTREWESLS